ncbi:50S ribosomal protein L28 [Actinosynnema pretiosum subsp. pretiosum]|uniref:Large ribosomal subunit protein bL28 n=2 Tax=Actinosynnema TaxID=40566 RepID=C6WJD8_ACTMD|nr:50S ribosomal protein L28 [Actinosynnema mirum]ACU34570.1 ribosomal protein L28 [Actinosynnema mirum DSM 43827]AXX27930.1 LSU ribosomal protein L28p [Actinosynnema pretiosum subsp. pretiosum]QUF07646.1 50S ribosomal protein L28 [Actinosynnema pretiosum subsp. pretiosum]
MSARHCQLTGRKPGYGKQVSHSHRRTNRRWLPNTQRRRYWLPSENRYVVLTLSTKGVKTVDRRGVESVVAELRRRGEKV